MPEASTTASTLTEQEVRTRTCRPSPRISQSVPVGSQWDQARLTERAVRSAELHGLTRPNCLERSMTLWWMLRLKGVRGDLNIGARKQGSQFEAHAWVELGGRVLNDDAEIHAHYARFDSPITAGELEPQSNQK